MPCRAVDLLFGLAGHIIDRTGKLSFPVKFVFRNTACIIIGRVIHHHDFIKCHCRVSSRLFTGHHDRIFRRVVILQCGRMQHRVDPFHRNIFGKGGIFAQKCPNPFICLFLHGQHRKLDLCIQVFQEIPACIGNLVNLRTAHIDIAVFFRKLTKDQIDHNHDRNHHCRQSHAVYPMRCSCRMK